MNTTLRCPQLTSVATAWLILAQATKILHENSYLCLALLLQSTGASFCTGCLLKGSVKSVAMNAQLYLSRIQGADPGLSVTALLKSLFSCALGG